MGIARISAGLRGEMPNAQIGELIGRDKSVVCREVVRNRGTDGSYWGRSRTGLPMSAAGNTKRSSLSRIRTCAVRSRPGWMTAGQLG